MDFNTFIFPTPKSSYTKNDFKENIIYIPKKDFSYKDKLKYNINISSIQESKNKKIIIKPNGKLVYHNKSSSMIQKVPSVTFTLDNKFEESEKKNIWKKI